MTSPPRSTSPPPAAPRSPRLTGRPPGCASAHAAGTLGLCQDRLLLRRPQSVIYPYLDEPAMSEGLDMVVSFLCGQTSPTPTCGGSSSVTDTLAPSDDGLGTPWALSSPSDTGEPYRTTRS